MCTTMIIANQCQETLHTKVTSPWKSQQQRSFSLRAIIKVATSQQY